MRRIGPVRSLRAAASILACLAGSIAVSGPAYSAEVDADPEFVTEFRTGPNTTFVLFFDDEGPRTVPDTRVPGEVNGAGTTDGVGGPDGVTGGGPSREEAHSAGVTTAVGAIMEPVITVVNNALGDLFGGGGRGSPLDAAIAKADSFARFLEQDLPGVEAQIDEALDNAYGPNGSVDSDGVHDEMDNLDGDGDCISSTLTVAFSGDRPMPSNEQYQTFLGEFLKETMQKLETVSREWNGDGNIVGLKEFYLGNLNWSFNRTQFLSSKVERMRAIDIAARKARIGQLASSLQVRADHFSDCGKALSDGPPTGVDANHTIPDDESEFRTGLRAIQRGLLNSRPDAPKEVAAKYAGLRAVRLADESRRAGNRDEAEAYREFAEGMLDVATGLIPGVSWVRDLYEVTTGYDLVTGRHLTLLERTGALLGVVSGGVGSKAIKMARAVDKGGAVGEIGTMAKKILDKARFTDHASAPLDNHATDRISEVAQTLKTSADDIKERVEIALDEGPRFWDIKEKSLVFAEAEWPDDSVGRLAAVMKHEAVMGLEPDSIRTVNRNFPADPTQVLTKVDNIEVPRYRPVPVE